MHNYTMNYRRNRSIDTRVGDWMCNSIGRRKTWQFSNFKCKVGLEYRFPSFHTCRAYITDQTCSCLHVSTTYIDFADNSIDCLVEPRR